MWLREPSRVLVFSLLCFVEAWSGDCGDCLASSDGDCYCCYVLTLCAIEIENMCETTDDWYTILYCVIQVLLRCLPPDDTVG